MGAIARIELVLLEQRGHLFPWTPVFLGLGIGGYFSLPVEPGVAVLAAVALAGAVMAAMALRRPGGWSAIGWGLALAAAGFALAGARARRVGAPVLGWRYYGPVEGRIVAIDRSASDALRLTLDRVRLDRLAPAAIPERVRISLHTDIFPVLRPGARIMTTAYLTPPQGPAEPGGFDFRRHAWFQSLGGVGYTRVPVLSAASGREGLGLLALRLAVARRIREVLPGDTGGFAAAVTTGDRSGMSQRALKALRASNLAHLLAISGLHMGLLAGFVFAALRFSLALIPPLALRLPLRKIAALGALIAAAGYLALSGGNVATERAFVMVAVALGAVLIDRRAFSLRAVAMAALIVLALRPEALLSPGFQMSFAATTGLVAVFGWLRAIPPDALPRLLRPIGAVVLSSTVAGAATAPFAAAHFNMLSHYGLLANLLSVPLMGLVVIPAAVLALVLAPLGLEAVGLRIMGAALNWILGVAHWVSGLPGALGHVISPGPWVLPLLSLGLLWLMLWQGRARLIGLLPVLAAFWLWSGAERPAVLVAPDGGLVGVMTDAGRALSKPRGGGFVAGIWLENDGDGADQALAAGRWPGQTGRPRFLQVGAAKIVHIVGKRAARRFETCKADQLVIASVSLSAPGPCTVYDSDRLRDTGALALVDGRILRAADLTGDRLWSRRQ